MVFQGQGWETLVKKEEFHQYLPSLAGDGEVNSILLHVSHQKHTGGLDDLHTLNTL